MEKCTRKFHHPSTLSLKNELFKVRLLKDMRKIINILSDPDCEVICPISIDYNDEDDDDDDDDNDDDVDYRN